MEDKKLDKNSIIGFILMGIIFLWMLYINQPTEEQIAAEEAKKEAEAQATKEAPTKTDAVTLSQATETLAVAQPGDSLAMVALQNKLGSFAYSGSLPSATNATTVIENDVLSLTISNKGGYVTEAKLKVHTTHESTPIYLIKNGNASLNLQFSAENRLLNTQDLFFEPTLSKNGDNNVLSMRLKTAADKYIEYRYELKPGEYMLDFSIKTQGLDGIVNTSQPMNLEWNFKGYRHARSITYENRYTRLTYEYENGKHDKLGQAGEDDADEKDVTWMNFRQHFFSSMLLTDTPFKKVKFTSVDLVEDETIDTVYTKQYGAKMLLEPKAGGLAYNMNMYYGPTDYKIFNGYDRNLDEAMPMGWGIFGVINKNIIVPLFDMLTNKLGIMAGLAIILMTILIKLALSPVQYKQYVAQAKMKVLKPELDAIKEKFGDNKMKIQQETMKLQNIAGASPLKGCLPAILQIPVFYALFTFFPTAFDLRQKSFLWADDLSSYDTIAELPFNIPFYGDHISLFPILASLAIFFYMTMTMGQSMQAQQQPGMPNMKFLMYLSPLFMLVFFNNYASGLSLYYFISNLLTIGIMLVIKYVIIDEEKIKAQIAVNKSKPKKQNKFQKKMAEMMEQAEAQKKANKK